MPCNIGKSVCFDNPFHTLVKSGELSYFMAAAVAPGAVPPPAQFNSRSIARYRGSAPINFRLILVNSLVLLGCAYILVTSLTRYATALDDLDRISKTSVLDSKPCGMAVPNLKLLFQSLKEIGDGAFAEDQESVYIDRARNAICGTSSVNNAIRSALQATEIEDDCCSTYPVSDQRYKTTDQLDASVNAYVCACASETCTNGHGFGDMIRRIRHAYVLSAPAFAIYADSETNGGTCASTNDPFSVASCATSDASIRTEIKSQLTSAADNSFKILSGKIVEGDGWPTTTQMLYRLMCLSIIEYYDRKYNSGGCFKNDGTKTAMEFCTTKLAETNNRPFGDALSGGCANAAEHIYYADRIANSDSCTYTAAEGNPSAKTALWTQRPRKFSESYAADTTLPVHAICSSMLEFGLLDRKRLFGLPDPVGEYEWYGEHSGNSFTRWLGGIGYWGLFDANKDKSEVSDKHTAYLDLKLYIAYRFAVTTAWVLAVLIACGYLFAFSSVPFLKLLYIRLVRRTLTNTRTDTILIKPTGSAETIALFTTVVIGLWVIFVDPAGYTPYVTTSECDDYALFGGAYATTAARPHDGLLGLALLLLGLGLFLYTATCRRPPKRQRIMPLDPFPLWPLMALILIVLLAVLLLMIRAGDTWWERESTRLDGSSTDSTRPDGSSGGTKTTQDFEDIVSAAIRILLFLGLLMGILNQRHMAANVILNVPRGRPVVFAYIWAGVAFSASVLAAVFAFPLFDCQIAWTTNELVCGDGTEINIQWNYFFGCIAFFACVIAVLYVFWASFKVLFSVPRKDDPESTAFNRSKDQEIAQLTARRFGRSTVAPNPFGTSAIVTGDGSITESNVDDDYDVYMYYGDSILVDSQESTHVGPPDRLRFDLGNTFTKQQTSGNVLTTANLLPVEGVAHASFCVVVEGENAPFLPQGV